MNLLKLNKIKVYLNLEENRIQIGTLISEGTNVYFKLHDTYLTNFEDFENNKLMLSPFKMIHTNEIQLGSKTPFEGLFGLFSDSLPDAWGRLLQDRYFQSKMEGLKLNPLNRLLCVGKNGSGALEYEPELQILEKQEIFNIDKFYAASKKILIGENSEILTNFYRLGGTSGGARPKINIGLNPITNELVDFTSDIPENFENWIVKFPSIYDLPDIANIEFSFYNMAKACGIEINECKLLNGKENTNFFATKRFDRIGNKKLHLHSLAGLIHDDFNMNNLDYGHLMDVAFHLEKDVNVYQKILRLAIFNVFACNQDDHSKNFSFIMGSNKKWRFSPAYDLTFSPSSYGFQSMSVAKNAKNITSQDFVKLSKHFHVKNINEILEEVKTNLTNWDYFAMNGGVSKVSRDLISKKIQANLKK